MRGSEQSKTYTAPDWEVALRCVELINTADREGGTTTVARHALTELRQLEDRLLVTVAARRRARVDLPGGKAGGDGRPVTGAGDSGGKIVDYRARLGARAAGGE